MELRRPRLGISEFLTLVPSMGSFLYDLGSIALHSQSLVALPVKWQKCQDNSHDHVSPSFYTILETVIYLLRGFGGWEWL